MPGKRASKYPKKSFTRLYKAPKETEIDQTYLIIVESPSKCKKIESFLGEEYKCIASMGHIRILDGLKAIDISNFTPKFEICPEKRDHVAYMRQVIAHFSIENIYIATDDDREGEAIGWHICQVFDLPVNRIKRAKFHEITQRAVVEAIKSPIGINMALVDAAISRQILDILIGFRISPILWKYICSSKSAPLSAGRCQTPALRLLYDNKQGLDKAVMRWTVKGSFFEERLDFVLSREFESREQVADFMEKSVLYNHEFTIDPVDKVSIRGAPKPFNTSTLLQTASNVLGMSPKETMSLCQQLYQDGHITYMRTDSQRLSSVFLSSAKKFIGDTWNPSYVVEDMSHIESTGCGGAHEAKGGAHEAIRPTDVSRTTIESKIARMGSLYHLIWKTTVESCMVDAKINVATIKVSCPLENAKYESHIETLAFAGWKIVAGKVDSALAQKNETLKWCLRQKKSNGVTYHVIRSESVMRNKGSHYTEAGLIKRLENLGIGRPSTYASIIDTIKERGYATLGNIEGQMHEVEDFVLNRDIGPRVDVLKTKKLFGQEKNKLAIQPIGELVVEFLMEHYRTLFEYEYTSFMEERLDKITEGVETTQAICGDCLHMIDELETATKECEKVAIPLDSDHVVVFEKYGAVIRTREKVEGEYVFSPMNKKFNLEKLQRGEYTLSDLQVSKEGHIENVQRIITQDLSIRLGKFGYYLYYKRKDMKAPEFYNLKKCKIAYLKCEDIVLMEWIKGNYPNII